MTNAVAQENTYENDHLKDWISWTGHQFMSLF